MEWNGIPLTNKTHEEVQNIIASTSNAEEIEIVIRSDYNMFDENLRCPIGKEAHREKTISFVDRKQNVINNHLEDDQTNQPPSYFSDPNYPHVSPQSYTHKNYYRPEAQVPHYTDQCPVNQYQDYSSSHSVRPNPYQVHRSHCSISEMNESAYRSRQSYAQTIEGQPQYYSGGQDQSNINDDVPCKFNIDKRYK